MSKSLTKSLFGWFLGLLALALGVGLIVRFLGESLWFGEVGYLDAFFQRLGWQMGLGLGITSLSLAFFVLNIRLARRLQWQEVPIPSTSRLAQGGNPERINPQSPPLSLPWLLFVVLAMATVLGLMLIYYGQIVWQGWYRDYYLSPLTSPTVLDSPGRMGLVTLALIGLLLALVLLRSRFLFPGIAVGFSLLLGLIFSQRWTTLLKAFNPTAFGELDPQYGLDIGFYVFTLPFLQLLNLWLWGLALYALISTILTYILSANSLSQGKFPGFSHAQLRHLYGLWGFLMAVLVFRHGLARFELLYSPRGVVYGGGYTDIHIQEPLQVVLAVLAAVISFWLFGKALTGKTRRKTFYFAPVYLYLMILLGGFLLTTIVQKTIVQPNELAQEKPYIERNIFHTRAGFGLDKIEVKVFNPQGNLTLEVLKKNALTIDNIRLWDTKPLLETNRQLQQIRLYYKFFDADIDRYRVNIDLQKAPYENTSNSQQVIISARELDYSTVPESAKTWVNQHLIYTHGYGFTLSPVNLVDEGGLPYYFVQDIGTNEDQGALKTSSESIRYSIPIGKPRIYFGELTDNYIMTSTKVKELDYPDRNDNAYNTYDGTGGINIGSPWRKLLFSAYLRDQKLLFTQDFTPDTKLLFRRTVSARIQAIAPFLSYDRNPYLVAADIGEKSSKLFWIIDAYTSSDHYPYSDPGQGNFNYIRNSVKIVVDAYNGDVNFYITDGNDPLIQTWNRIFPKQFQTLAEMPSSLRQHIRYPEDLFRIQSERLLTYHMKDAQVFYNREDQWQIPQEIYGNEAKEVEPYYLIMKLPEANSEEFILLQPYNPASRPNLIAWLAARSDDPHYGKLLLYQFPKQELIYGPNQIEALINQNPQISQQISLWSREGSKVKQGNLLVIPIEQSLLYVEPLYIVADQNSVPTLARVIVVYNNKIVMAETLTQALDTIFGDS